MRLASACFEGTIQVWNAATGQEILKFRTGENVLWSVAWSPDGKRLATGSGDRTARIWDAATGRRFSRFTDSAVRSGRSRGALTVSVWRREEADTVKVWDAVKGQEIVDLKGKAEYPVAWSPDGKRLATGKESEIARFSGFGRPHGSGAALVFGERLEVSSRWPGAPMESGWPRVSMGTGRGSGRPTRGGSCSSSGSLAR